jgi:hypothetical protein
VVEIKIVDALNLNPVDAIATNLNPVDAVVIMTYLKNVTKNPRNNVDAKK